MKRSAAKDGEILSKYGLDISLVPEREEDKRVATLLGMKLKPPVDIAAKTEMSRKRIISSSSLPSSFTPDKERKVMRILNGAPLKGMNIIKKVEKNFVGRGNEQSAVENTSSASETELEAHANGEKVTKNVENGDGVNRPDESIVSPEIITDANVIETDVEHECDFDDSSTSDGKKTKVNLSLVGDYGSSSENE